MAHSDFAHAFRPGARFEDEEGRHIVMSQREVGRLKVVSGRVCCLDPLTVDYDGKNSGFAHQVPRAEFAVEAAVATLSSEDARVACARVRFDESLVAVRWEPALCEGESMPEEGEAPGSGVDSGTWGFFDASLCAPINESTSEAWLAALQENSVSTWTFLDAALGEANVIMVSSGWGDGFYCSYLGFAEDGRLVELVTDFDVLMGPAESERVVLECPPRRGKLRDAVLARYEVTARIPLLGRRAVILGGKGTARLVAADEATPIGVTWRSGGRRYVWPKEYTGELAILVMKGHAPYRTVPPQACP